MVFCAVLRWEPFVSRYMLSYLALLCPVIGIQLQNRLAGIPRYALAAAVILLCAVDLSYQGIYHWTIVTKSEADQRPEGYFVNRHVEYEPYAALCAAIDEGGYVSVGLTMGADDYEYPLWRMLPDEVMRIEHVGVTNQSADYADSSFRPDCIIWLGAEPDAPYEYNGKIYEKWKEYGEGHYLLYSSP